MNLLLLKRLVKHWKCLKFWIMNFYQSGKDELSIGAWDQMVQRCSSRDATLNSSTSEARWVLCNVQVKSWYLWLVHDGIKNLTFLLITTDKGVQFRVSSPLLEWSVQMTMTWTCELFFHYFNGACWDNQGWKMLFKCSQKRQLKQRKEEKNDCITESEVFLPIKFEKKENCCCALKNLFLVYNKTNLWEMFRQSKESKFIT